MADTFTLPKLGSSDEELERQQNIKDIIESFVKAGPMVSSSAMVIYSDLGKEQTQAVIAAAAKIISESDESDFDCEEFKNLVNLFKNEE